MVVAGKALVKSEAEEQYDEAKDNIATATNDDMFAFS